MLSIQTFTVTFGKRGISIRVFIVVQYKSQILPKKKIAHIFTIFPNSKHDSQTDIYQQYGQ